MARGKKGIDGVDKVIDLFPASSAKKIERVLLRAADRDARAAGRQLKAALGGAGGASRSTRRIATRLAGELVKALHHRGDVGGNRASIRQRAPDSGGRPFHFAHSVVTKADVPAPSGSAPAGGKSKAGRAAAHMRYIEREVAVERLYGSGLDAAERGQGLDARGRDDGSWDREPGRGSPDIASTSAGQAYIENPVKLESGERVLFSFGTIGDTFNERVAFWEALETAEAHPSARVQHRLIVELPHEASAEARFEMMKTFCARFEADGIPYWAALHAPGDKNDARNFHAHIVYSERPAMKMVDPATGQEAWDFSIVTTYKKKSRNTISNRPHRQDKLRKFNDRRFIPGLRTEFAKIVTTVLDRDVVKDATGAPVRYDARSYKNMGVDAVPMKAINRIVADKMKEGTATILDTDYTKRSVTAELREAAAKRDKDVMGLIALDDALRASAATKRPQDRNEGLPREMRISAFAMVTGPMLRSAGRRLMEAKYEALQVDVMERATVASLEKIVTATSPKAVAAARRAKNPTKLAAAPSIEAAKMLHEAALEELAETRRSSAQARQTVRYRIGAALNAWKTMVGADLLGATTPSRSMAHDVASRTRSETNEKTLPGEASVAVQPGDLGNTRADRATSRADPSNTATRDDTERRARKSGNPPRPSDRTDVGAARDAIPTTAQPTTPTGVDSTPDAWQARQKAPESGPSADPRAAKDRPVDGASSPAPKPGSSDKPKQTTPPKPLTMEGALKFRTMSESIDEASRQASASRIAAAADGPPIMVTREQAAMFSKLPTPGDLAEASKLVTGWIDTIRNSEPDPDKRLDFAEAFIKGLVKDMKAMSPPDSRASAKGDTAPTTRAAAPPSPVRPPAEQGRTAPSSPSAHVSQPTEGRPQAGPDTTGTSTSASKGPSPLAPPAASEASAEHPDDAKRRKKRERKIEDQKKKRKAVLARKNKERSR